MPFYKCRADFPFATDYHAKREVLIHCGQVVILPGDERSVTPSSPQSHEQPRPCGLDAITRRGLRLSALTKLVVAVENPLNSQRPKISAQGHAQAVSDIFSEEKM